MFMTMTISDHNLTFRTADLCLATILSLSLNIETIERVNPRKVQFVFQQDKKLDKLVDEFWKGEIRIEPQTFFNQLRVLKARIYND
jgi:hypothetical protein